jgi:hypothetical protein
MKKVHIVVNYVSTGRKNHIHVIQIYFTKLWTHFSNARVRYKIVRSLTFILHIHGLLT